MTFHETLFKEMERIVKENLNSPTPLMKLWNPTIVKNEDEGIDSMPVKSEGIRANDLMSLVVNKREYKILFVDETEDYVTIRFERK